MRSVSIALALTFIITASSLNLSFAQEDQSAQYQYSESAIRRFEIITLVSLPFTSIHSYLIVRLVEMARQGEVSPDLSNGDWHAIQAVADLEPVAAVAGGYHFKIFLPKGHVRFEAWLTPFQHPADSGYQIIQSLFALFHGAVLGRGVGEGIPGKIPGLI